MKLLLFCLIATSTVLYKAACDDVYVYQPKGKYEIVKVKGDDLDDNTMLAIKKACIGKYICIDDVPYNDVPKSKRSWKEYYPTTVSALVTKYNDHKIAWREHKSSYGYFHHWYSLHNVAYMGIVSESSKLGEQGKRAKMSFCGVDFFVEYKGIYYDSADKKNLLDMAKIIPIFYNEKSIYNTYYDWQTGEDCYYEFKAKCTYSNNRLEPIPVTTSCGVRLKTDNNDNGLLLKELTLPNGQYFEQEYDTWCTKFKKVGKNHYTLNYEDSKYHGGDCFYITFSATPKEIFEYNILHNNTIDE